MQRFWVCDIGGTNCRLAGFVIREEPSGCTGGNASDDLRSRLDLVQEHWERTEDVCTEEALLAAFERHISERDAIQGLGIAIAGPVHGGEAGLTNGQLLIRRTELERRLKVPCVLVNDFVAQAFACVSPKGKAARCLREGSPDTSDPAVRAVTGPGTGLGVAVLVGDSSLLPLPSEAGHMPFPFQKGEERIRDGFETSQVRRSDYVSCEDVLSGRGISVLCALLTGKHLTAREVAEQEFCSETEVSSLYAAFFGRFCQSLLCMTLPRAGLYISGGILIQNPLLLELPSFRAALDAVTPVPQLREIPVYLFENTNIGLWGAACALLDHQGRVRKDRI